MFTLSLIASVTILALTIYIVIRGHMLPNNSDVSLIEASIW